MSERTQSYQGLRLVYRHSKPLTKLVVAVAVLLSLVTLFSLRSAQDRAEREMYALWEQARALERENQQLELDIALLGTSESVRRIAQEDLHLVQPDTIFFQPVN